MRELTNDETPNDEFGERERGNWGRGRSCRGFQPEARCFNYRKLRFAAPPVPALHSAESSYTQRLPMPEATPEQITAFITRWSSSGAAERANYQMFLSELCDILGVPRPAPS